jgi:capsular exopolysaccharide synthesis family protein
MFCAMEAGNLLSEQEISTVNQTTSRALAGADIDPVSSTLRSRLALISGCVLGALLVGGIYLAATPKKYVAVSKVLVERMASSKEATDAVIDAQADVIRSGEVLRLAESKAMLGDLHTFKGVRDPVPVIRKNLTVESDRSGSSNVLTITYPAASDSDAVEILDSVVSAYRGYQSDVRQQETTKLNATLADDRKAIADQLSAASKALSEYDLATGGAGIATPAERLSSVSGALTEATLDTLSAKRRYDEAIAAAGGALAGMNDEQTEKALLDASVFAPESPEIIEQEARMLETQLSDLRKTYAENHPAMIRATARLKQVRIAQAASTRSRWQAAQQRETDLQKSLGQLQRDASVQTAKQAERARLAGEVTRLQARADELDSRLQEIRLMAVAGSLNISVLTPAEANHPAYPTLPRTMPTLMLSALIGLALGGLFSIVSELRSSNRVGGTLGSRSLPLIDSTGQTLGIKKLGSIPETNAAAEGHPLEMLAQEDPFGEFANAVRNLRGACEVEGALPASMILTSASSGEGKTTLATNLAFIIAREGRKVLLVDLNFEKPSLHTLLGVEGERGLSELLDGGDAVELVRSSSIPRVDVLPAGARPADSTQLLNSDALPRILSMLTSAYDHVIFDGNALAFGDDARVVASLTDATILVSKDAASSLRRAAGARDMLLMVGANLLGVALTRSRPVMSAGPTL